MADDALHLDIPAPLADEIRAATKARGLTPEDYVRQQLELDVATDELDWAEDGRRLKGPGEDIPLDKAFSELRVKVSELRAKK